MPAVSYAGANVGGRALGVMLVKQHSPVEITRRNELNAIYLKGNVK